MKKIVMEREPYLEPDNMWMATNQLVDYRERVSIPMCDYGMTIALDTGNDMYASIVSLMRYGFSYPFSTFTNKWVDENLRDIYQGMSEEQYSDFCKKVYIPMLSEALYYAKKTGEPAFINAAEDIILGYYRSE